MILLATLRHVVQIAGQLSRNNPRPNRYLSSDCFRRERNIVSTGISTFLFSYLTWRETKLVLLSLAIVTLKSALPESAKKSPKYAVNVFEVKKVTSRLLIFSPT